MVVHVSRRSPRSLASVSGAPDRSGGALLAAMREHVRQTDGGPVEVDLAAVDYADSYGLAPLLDRRVTISRTSRVVRRLFPALRRPLAQWHEEPLSSSLQ